MYNNMMSQEYTIEQPATIAVLRESIVQDVLSLQADYMLKQLNCVFLRSKALALVDSPKETLTQQLKYLEDLTNDLTEITGQEIDALEFYKTELIKAVNKNIVEVPIGTCWGISQ